MNQYGKTIQGNTLKEVEESLLDSSFTKATNLLIGSILN